MLVRRWQRRLWRYARRLTHNDDAAWDVMQETWIAILKQIRQLNDPAWFAAWAHRIVRNKSVDDCRRATQQRQLATAMTERQQTNNQASQEDPDNAVAQAMLRLPPEKQELLELKYGEDLNTLEIALILGIPPGTVKSRLHNTREHLRRILKGDLS